MSLSHALVVDDSRSARFALKKLLEEQSIEVSLAASGEEALDFLQKTPVDVVFMDHTMPGMDGLEAVAAIKANPDTATIPVMMYTTREGEVYVGQARALGAVGVLPKNVQPHQLFEMLASLGLVKDRRSAAREVGDEEADAQLDEQVTGISVQNIVQRILEDQHLTLRSDILRSQRTFAKEVAKEIILEQARAEEDDLIEAAPNASNNWMTAALVVLVAVLAFLSWQFKHQRDLLATQMSDFDQQRTEVIDTTLDSLQADLASSEASAATYSERASAALVWALNSENSAPFDSLSFGNPLANKVSELLRRLEGLQYRGTLRLTSHLGQFCMTVDPSGAYQLADPTIEVSSCDYLGHPLEASARVSDRLSIPFSRIYQQYSEPPLRLQLVALSGGESQPVYDYPGATATAGEWNRIAGLNNRVVFELLPATP